MVLSTEIWKYKYGKPSSAKLHWNKPTAMRLAFITKVTYSWAKKELFLLLKKAVKHYNTKSNKNKQQ